MNGISQARFWRLECAARPPRSLVRVAVARPALGMGMRASCSRVCSLGTRLVAIGPIIYVPAVAAKYAKLADNQFANLLH